MCTFEAREPSFCRLPFPLYLLFSPGITGVPKCMAYSAGGMSVQSLKCHVLHCGLTTGDRLFDSTTVAGLIGAGWRRASREIVHGRLGKNREALGNPEVLDLDANL
ncbi:hypothetical protein C8J36_103342 [Rhizobium sp. PP-F2F-G48]|nr:hypothetical protein C8J36_103342 [Rhizobium sp. PP-F2F-G48]